MNDKALHGHPEAMRAMAKQMSELGLTVNEAAAKIYSRLAGMSSAGDWDDRNHRQLLDRFETNGKALQAWMKELEEQIGLIQRMAEDYERAMRSRG